MTLSRLALFFIKIFVVFCSCQVQVLHAQNLPVDIPDPSQLEDQFDDKRLPPRGTTVLVPGAADDLTPSESDIRFTLKKVNIVGSTVFDDVDFLTFYEGYLNQEISIAQAFQVAGEMTAFYRNNGYILSQVVVPVQSIVDGNLTLTVVEGFIDQVLIESDLPSGEDFVLAMAKKIKASHPLNSGDLERYILLINDIPGIKARAVLHASDTQGAANLSIVVEQDQLTPFFSVDNRGSKFNGPVQGQIRAEVNSLLGAATKTGFRVIGTLEDSEFRLLELRHQRFFGSEGTNVSVSLRDTVSKPGDSLQPLEIESKSNSALITLSKPVLRSRAKNLFLRSSLDIRNTRTDVLSAPFTEDKVRVARLAVQFDFIDRLDGINLVDVELSHGLDILGSSETGDSQNSNRDISRADAENRFYKVNGSFQRLQKLAPGVSLLFGVSGQYTQDGLFASEEMALGGSTYGRAFDPAELTGERGVAVRAELRYDGTLESDFINRYQTFLYTDYGTIWDRQTDGNYLSSSLGSAGGGIRLNLSERYTAYLELVVPTDSTSEHKEKWGNSPRGFFGINAKL